MGPSRSKYRGKEGKHMSDLLQAVLTDKSARRAGAAKRVVASSSEDFAPWGGIAQP